VRQSIIARITVSCTTNECIINIYQFRRITIATYQKAQDFVEQIGRGAHLLHSHTFNIFLATEFPSPSLDALKADVTEVTTGNGYTTGGIALTGVTWVETAGTATFTCTNDPSWTASGAGIANIRSAVLFNDSQATPAKPLVASWDYGSTITLLAAGESFSVTIGASIFTLS
jgi:hypothetical protein